jgi:triphosphoribosyl-dephospho-CoA synthase
MNCHNVPDLAMAYRDACLAELRALKPGNVHVYAEGHGGTVEDFEVSAQMSAPALTRHGASVGARILGAIQATHACIGWNTNLGIVLLCAPLAAAAEQAGPLQASLSFVLQGLTLADASDAFAAIRLASPGGLGKSDQHDVVAPATVDLRTAMATAADRDRIARAYVTDFAEIFEIGLPALQEARLQGLSDPWCTTAVHMAFLSYAPDTHIERKFGHRTAEFVRARASEILRTVQLGPNALDSLLALDAELKKGDLNPGTTADFTVATLFAASLMRFPASNS